MRSLDILLAEPQTGIGYFTSVFEAEYGFKIINLGNSFRSELKKDSDLGKELLCYVDKGELVPTHLIFQLLEQDLLVDNKKSLVVNFPRFDESFLELKELLINLDIKLKKIWYLKIKDIEYLAKQDYENGIKHSKAYYEKYEITIDSIKNNLQNRAEYIRGLIHKIKQHQEIITIEIDYENEVPSEQILKIIKGYA